MNDEDGLICSHCWGRGLLKDDVETGRELRGVRDYLGVEQRAVAKAMKLSASYLSDLERGRRNWSGDLVRRYREALETVTVARQQEGRG